MTVAGTSTDFLNSMWMSTASRVTSVRSMSPASVPSTVTGIPGSTPPASGTSTTSS